MAAIYAGDFMVALKELERGIAVYDPAAHGAGRSPVYWTGHDSGVSCAVHAAVGAVGARTSGGVGGSAWSRGCPGRAPQPIRLRSRTRRPSPSILAECRRDVVAVRAIVETGVLDSDHGFELLTILAALHRGWLDGDPDAMRASVAAFRARGGGIGAPAFMALTAEAYAHAGRADEGLQWSGTPLRW
jgi:hypothetical protein